MIIRISDYLGVDNSFFSEQQIHDPFIGIDSELFIDPQLLTSSKTKEFVNSRKRVEEYFGKIISLLSLSESKEDLLWRKARQLLTFKELKGLSIGYGKQSSDGNAIGPELASALTITAQQIISFGIKDPAIFEILGLFEDGFGADRLSDMIARIIAEDIFKYSERITKLLLTNKNVSKPVYNNLFIHPQGRKPILFLPTELLRDLPIALDRDGIDYVVRFNQELRDRLNQLIGGVWSTKKPKKSDYKALFLSHPDKFKELVDLYKKKPSYPYNLKEDPQGKEIWHHFGQTFAKKDPIHLELRSNPTLDDVQNIVEQIIFQFKKCIETNGLNSHLYSGGKHRPERFAQLLFLSIADTYCKANDLDLSPETNSGSGFVDFKISRGYSKRVLVETKLSTNPNILRGYSVQLPAYQDSEQTKKSFYVVIKVGNNKNQINEILKLQTLCNSEGRSCPKVIVVDGIRYPSASVRRLIN